MDSKQADFESLLKRDGLTYEEYMQSLRDMLLQPLSPDATELEIRRREYTALNVRRSERVWKTFTPPGELQKAVEEIAVKQTWMILTEGWCGDSAQTVPVFVKSVSSNPLIKVRLLLRDQHLSIMDRYLTNGTRSIPKLVVFSGEGRELLQWGPRPAPAADLWRNLNDGRKERSEMAEALHLWYGRDRGKSTALELLNLLRSLSETQDEDLTHRA